MKFRLISILGLSLLLFALLAFSCTQSAGNTVKTVSISRVGFNIDDVATDWWSASATTKPSLIYNFTISFTGNILQSDVSYARVYFPNSSTWYWPLDPTTRFSSANSTISQSGFWYNDNINELPIGTMKAEIKLTNGVVADYSFSMGIPGNTTPNGDSYVYSIQDESTATYPTVSVPAVEKPTISSFTHSGSLVINFTVHGNNVHNGFAWFYDSSNTYLGAFGYFLDKTTGAVTSKINGGSGTFNHVDAGTNTLTLAVSDLVDANNNPMTQAVFDTIQHCRVVVCDGLQYVSTVNYADYDYRAISASF